MWRFEEQHLLRDGMRYRHSLGGMHEKLPDLERFFSFPPYFETLQFYLHQSCSCTQTILIHTTQNSQNKQTKISDLETNIFESNMMVKNGLFFILKFYQALQSCCQHKKLPGKAEWAVQVSRCNSQGASRISNNQTTFHHHI